MVKAGVFGLEPLLVPSGITLRTEKVGTHVVINAVDFPAESGEVVDDFRADEAGGTGDEEFHEG